MTMFVFPMITITEPTDLQLKKLHTVQPELGHCESIDGTTLLRINLIQQRSLTFNARNRPVGLRCSDPYDTQESALPDCRQEFIIPALFVEEPLTPGFIATEGSLLFLEENVAPKANQITIVSDAAKQPLRAHFTGSPFSRGYTWHPYTSFLSNDVTVLYVTISPQTGCMQSLHARTHHASIEGDRYVLESKYHTLRELDLAHNDVWQAQIAAAEALYACRDEDCQGHYCQ